MRKKHKKKEIRMKKDKLLSVKKMAGIKIKYHE
jgi:hypothetical protein